MDTYTLLIFYLPIFIFTLSVYLFIINFKNKKEHTPRVKIFLDIAHYLILLILLLELIFWFILPAYNYNS
jgi:uncharacterized membrane protein YqjE